VHYHDQQIACFEQADGFPLRMGNFVPMPEEPVELDFIPESLSLERGW